MILLRLLLKCVVGWLCDVCIVFDVTCVSDYKLLCDSVPYWPNEGIVWPVCGDSNVMTLMWGIVWWGYCCVCDYCVLVCEVIIMQYDGCVCVLGALLLKVVLSLWHLLLMVVCVWCVVVLLCCSELDCYYWLFVDVLCDIVIIVVVVNVCGTFVWNYCYYCYYYVCGIVVKVLCIIIPIDMLYCDCIMMKMKLVMM